MNSTNKQNNSEELIRPRSRIHTITALNDALNQLVNKNQRVTISAVALVAGVTPALIHNKYPSIAEAIRIKNGKGTKSKSSLVREQLVKAQEIIKELRNERQELTKEVQKLASINEGLRRQFTELQAISKSNNVVSLSVKDRTKD
jgi:hypothetical protein